MVSDNGQLNKRVNLFFYLFSNLRNKEARIREKKEKEEGIWEGGGGEIQGGVRMSILIRFQRVLKTYGTTFAIFLNHGKP